MRLPICGACLESEKLCEACSERLKNNEIKHSDVELARAMTKVSEQHPQLEKAEFLKTHAVDDVFVVEVPKGSAGQIIGRKGALIKELCTHMGKRIKVVEETNEKRDFVEKVLNPAKMKGLTVGDNSFKIYVDKMDEKRVGNKEPFEKIFSEIMNGKVEIVFG
jgi:transcription antitermination factor NusA-like protein|tara:strand:+ start:2878 stop:3366 length:489 start_codon:yes stop_codon:yes gene_type:complete